MTGLVATNKPGIPALSKGLEHALWRVESRECPQEGTWPALRFPKDLKAEAAQKAKALESSLINAPREIIARWLSELGKLTAGARISEREAISKVGAYADMLQHPAWVFNTQTLRMAAAQFKFFPSYAEVNSFLCELTERERALLRRLREIANALDPEPDVPRATPEQIARIKEAHGLYTAAPKRKLGLNWESPLSPAKRKKLLDEITAKEQARREREKTA